MECAKSTRLDWLETIRRLVLFLGLCLWFGGFTFYSLVVIHTGHRVFGSRVEVGFLTQAVTGWLNLIGVGAIMLMLWNVIAVWNHQNRIVRAIMVVTWLVTAAIEAALFLLHPKLDALLDPGARSMVYHFAARVQRFAPAVVQWAVTIVSMWITLWTWRTVDRTVKVASCRPPSCAS